MTVPAERAVVGAMLLHPDAIAQAAELLTADDFYVPSHAAIFTACVDLWNSGERPDATLVFNRLRATGVKIVEPHDLVQLMADVPSWNPVPHARIVVEASTRRSLQHIAASLSESARDPQIPILDVIDRARTQLDRAGTPALPVVDDVVTVEEFASAPDSPLSWVIPGLIDVEDRVIIVAFEGIGKSVLTRWLAAATSQGMHPFTLRPIPPAPALLIDLENPARIVRKTLRPMLAGLRSRNGYDYDPSRLWIWHRRGGIDLRTRAGAADLDAVIARTKPRLVCLGPLYKAFRSEKGAKDHDTASEVAAVLDDLRTRHNFALVLEHHAPLAQSGNRPIRPFGSLLWSQWPEIGIALGSLDETNRRLKVGFYRGSRDERVWPETLTRGTDWPWIATYPDNRWQQEEF